MRSMIARVYFYGKKLSIERNRHESFPKSIAFHPRLKGLSILSSASTFILTTNCIMVDCLLWTLIFMLYEGYINNFSSLYALIFKRR